MRGLDGKTFIIAGGASGIGAGTAERLAGEGASVVVGDINIAGAETTVQRITAAGGTAVAVEFDIADDPSVRALVDRAVTEFGGVDGLHNVAADLSEENIGRDKTILDTDLGVWSRTFDVNLFGFVRTIRAVLPLLLERGGGAIVNTSSGAALGNDPVRAAYSCSKAAINQLTRHVAQNWGGRGVRSNCVMPGLVQTETMAREESAEQMTQMFMAMAFTHRVGTPADLAAVTAFLLSDDAEWINGQTWYIGGAIQMRQ